jgi:nucleotide-binding universal stress UspA family protein
MRSGTIVVGTDGSPSGTSAVRWAAGTAEFTGRPLEIAVAYHWQMPGRWYGNVDDLTAAADERAGAIAAAAATEAQQVAPHTRVMTTLRLGDPAPVLLGLAKDASMLVVGNRGHGGFSGLLLGSVGVHVATHAHCPVALVRGRAEDRFSPVVVGVDVAHSSERPISLAFEQAAARHCPLHAITAHAVPLPPSPIGIPPVTYEPQAVRDELYAELVRQTAGWCGKYPDVAVEEAVVDGGPGAVLVDQSRRAQLVVVGTRGHGGMSGWLLGSTGLHLLHHAFCPVLIARG